MQKANAGNKRGDMKVAWVRYILLVGGPAVAIGGETGGVFGVVPGARPE